MNQSRCISHRKRDSIGVVDAVYARNSSIGLISVYLLYCYCSSRVSRDGKIIFRRPPSGDAASGGGAKISACFTAMWITESRCQKIFLSKASCHREFRPVHQGWRGQGETAHSVDEYGDHAGTSALLFSDFTTDDTVIKIE